MICRTTVARPAAVSVLSAFPKGLDFRAVAFRQTGVVVGFTIFPAHR